MFNGHTIAVVVAAYREERHIAEVITTMPALVDHIVVVDDASPDATHQRAADTREPRLRLIRHETNRGAGAARATAHRAALDLGADVVVVMDGDGQMDPDYLPALLEPVTTGGYGFAKANRFFSATSFAGMPRLRIAGNIALTFLTKVSSGYWNLVDPQNGYTAIRADVLRRLNLDALSSGYDYENDLLVWLNILDVPAVDVPVPAVYGAETSTLRVGRDGLRIARTLHRGFWRRMWRKYVLWSFSPVALLFFSALFLLTVAAGFTVSAALAFNPSRALPTASVLLVFGPALSGFYLLVQSLLLDIQATPKPAPPATPPR